MFKGFKKNKISKKDFFLFGSGILAIGVAVFLVVFTLIFLIKKINISLKPLPANSSELHFNISGAKKLFPVITPISPSTSSRQVPSVTTSITATSTTTSY